MHPSRDQIIESIREGLEMFGSEAQAESIDLDRNLVEAYKLTLIERYELTTHISEELGITLGVVDFHEHGTLGGLSQLAMNALRQSA